MDAYAAGKPVECSALNADIWELVSVPIWEFMEYKYRPAREPELVPWSLEKHPPGAIFVRGKGNKAQLMIIAWYRESARIYDVGLTVYSDILINFEHIDGDEVKPCGYYK